MSSASPPYVAAIVGGGASGALVAAQIGRQASVPCRIVLFDPADHFGRGLAYGTRDLTHLLNVPAGKISALPDQPGHFLEWLNREGNPVRLLHEKAYEPGEFVPRAIYGCYLASLVEDIFSHPSCLATLEIRPSRVVDFVSTGSGGTIVTSDGDTEDVGHLVLALGNLPPRDPLPHPDPFFQSERYLSRAPQAASLEVTASDDLLLVGSGLTSVDVILGFEARGHRGRYFVTSRSGRWPQAHGPSPVHPDFLADRALPDTARTALRILRDEIALAAAAGGNWRGVIDAVRPHTTAIWKGLPDEEKRRFLRHLRSFWECHRHRMPPSAWQQLEVLRDAGRLELIPGRIRAFSESPNGVDVRIQPRGHAGVITLQVPYVINCIGPESNFRQHYNDPLLVNLLARGVLHPDPLFLGLRATEEGHPIASDGSISSGISLIGPPLRGVLWETTAIPEIRTQAAQVADTALRHHLHAAWEI